MGVCVSNGLFSLFPCKVLPTLTISWFPKLVFFGSIIFLLHSTSKPLHLLLLHSMSSPGWFLLVLQASGQRLPAQRSLSSPTYSPTFTTQNTIFSYYSWNKSLLAIILFIHLTASFLPSSTVRTAQEQRPAGLGSILAPAPRTQHVGETQNIFI